MVSPTCSQSHQLRGERRQPNLPLPNASFYLPHNHVRNTFVPQVSIDPNITTPDDVYVGLSMIFTSTGLMPGVNTTSTEVISVLNETDRVAVAAWGSNDPVEDLRAEHPTVLTACADGLTRSVSYETYYGAGAVAVLALAANLQREFVRENEDLQGFVEGFG